MNVKYEDLNACFKGLLNSVKSSNIFTERQFRLARKWSNKELLKFTHLFDGDIVNVSGWIDADKEGKKYRDYFINKRTYSITNHDGYRGFQKLSSEIHLDLGCGFGAIAEPVTKELGTKYIGIDSNSFPIKHLQNEGFESYQFTFGSHDNNIEFIHNILKRKGAAPVLYKVMTKRGSPYARGGTLGNVPILLENIKFP